MNDARIHKFKLRAEKDNAISNGARALILRICTWRYGVKHHAAGADFALSWKDMAAWFGVGMKASVKDKETIYAWLRELILHRYLYKNELTSCPATRQYRLTFHVPDDLWLFDFWSARGAVIWQRDGGKTPQLVGEPNHQLEGGKNRQLVGGKIRPPHNSYSLREEMYKTKGKKLRRAGRARQRNGRGKSSSLRSGKHDECPLSDGKDAATGPKKQSPVEDRGNVETTPSATGRTAGTNPPARAGNGPRSLAPATQRMMDLHKARFYIETNATNHLNDHLVSLLLEAGDTLPEAVAQQFSALVDKFNPVPG